MVNIRKIAKWFNLKWSNTLSKKLPKFQHDLLVISNRLLNNSDFMKDEKLKALREMSLQTRNPYFLSGILKIFGYHWKFQDMLEILIKYKELSLPFPEDVRDNLVRFCVLRLKKPPLAISKPELTEEDLKNIKDAISIYNECNPSEAIPFLKEDGRLIVTLEDFIKYHKYELPENFIELTGQLLINQQFELMVELYDNYYFMPEAKRIEPCFRAMKSYNALQLYKKSIELMHDLLNTRPNTSISHDLWSAIGEIPNGYKKQISELVTKGLIKLPKDKDMPPGLKKLSSKLKLGDNSKQQNTEPKNKKKELKFNDMIDEIIDDDGTVHVNPNKHRSD